MEKFFDLKTEDRRGELVVSLDIGGRTSDLDLYTLLHEGGDVKEPMVGYVQSGTRSEFDAASCDSVSPILFSEKFFGVLKLIGSTGYKKHSIPLITSKNQKIEGFGIMGVSGRSGPIRKEKSSPYLAPPAVPGGKSFMEFRGAFFDESSWDGSEVFIPQGTRKIVVTSKVAQAIASAKLKNIQLTPMSELNMLLMSQEIISTFGQAYFDELKSKGLV